MNDTPSATTSPRLIGSFRVGGCTHRTKPKQEQEPTLFRNQTSAQACIPLHAATGLLRSSPRFRPPANGFCCARKTAPPANLVVYRGGVGRSISSAQQLPFHRESRQMRATRQLKYVQPRTQSASKLLTSSSTLLMRCQTRSIPSEKKTRHGGSEGGGSQSFSLKRIQARGRKKMETHPDTDERPRCLCAREGVCAAVKRQRPKQVQFGGTCGRLYKQLFVILT